MRSIRVVLRGGLGNQLFQYGAGHALSIRNEAQLIIDTSLLPPAAETLDGVTRWPSQIGEFHHLGTLELNKSSRKSPLRFSAHARQLERFVGDKAPRTLSRLGRFSNEVLADLDTFKLLSSNRILINSYCNSPSFFLGYGDQIRSTIRDLRAPSVHLSELLHQAEIRRPLAVHIRLGDYRNLSDVYGEVDPEYIARAIALQTKLSGEREIWLFSDELQIARELLRVAPELINTPATVQKLSPLETVLLMAACDGLVAANSTFSWWAAYLNENSESAKIFPRPFFAKTGPPEPKDWLMENWIQLGRNI